MSTKKCPYCGQLLDNAAFKCTRCNKWVDNEVFNRLCEDDVKLIKDNDLTPFTPTLIAAMVINLLDEDIRKLVEETLNEEQQFNLLVFNSFCYFKPICSFVKMKQGYRRIITEMLKVVLFQGVIELFRKRVKHPPLVEVLNAQAEALYTKFESILARLEPDPSSQMQVSNAFASTIFADNKANLIRGLHLYTRFMNTYSPDLFSEIFLVAEEDFDWRGIAGT